MHADDHGHSRRSPQHGSRGHAQEGDPVCGMAVDAETAEHTHEYRGRTWYFCSESCRRKFAAEPERYAGAKEKSAASVSAAADAIYTCPMHPEIRQIGPGNCPKCGMALEPVEPLAAEEGPNPELVDMTRRFWVSLALTVPLFALAMVEMLAPALVARLSVTANLWT